MSDEIKSLEEAYSTVVENVNTADEARQIEREETFIEGAETLSATDEVVTVETLEQEWFPTHYIGETPVQERRYANGLPYWVTKEGKRRVSSKNHPRRPYVPAPDPAKMMFLDREAFALACAVLSGVEDHVENGYFVADKVDAQHVKLTIADGRSQVRYLIQLPDQVQVIGQKIN